MSEPDRVDIPVCPPADPNPRPPRLRLPRGATDCHAHVFDGAAFGYQPNRAYTPPDAPFRQLRALHRVLGIERLVLVQASVHGTDNAAILDALATDPERLRGICAVKPAASDDELAALDRAGIRGIRVNLVDKGGMPFDSLAELGAFSRRIAPFGWHVELLIHAADAAAAQLRELASTVAVPMSIGHAGYTHVSRGGLRAPGFREFLAMLRDGHFWVKLTGPYRISAEPAPPYGDMAEMARAVVEAAPERTLWGSDWPHVMVWKDMPNDGDLVDLLADWVPDEALRDRILVANPAALYGF